MIESIVKDRKRILPCAAYLQGEYGLRDLFFGVPVKLGQNGAEDIIQISLTPEEQHALNHSAEHVQANLAKLDL
jgi:malate dehydrogenase